MDQEEVFRKIQAALNLLYRRDAKILERKFDINERTVTYRLGIYLYAKFKEYDVDCEYNRMLDQSGNTTEGDYWVKSLNLSTGNVSGEDDEATTVFPDIIIHKRKLPINLVVIEVKLAWKSRKKSFDIKKLKAYKRDLKYKYAVYIEINENEYLIKFIES